MLKFIVTLLFAQVLLAAPFPKQSTNGDGNDAWVGTEPTKPEGEGNEHVNGFVKGGAETTAHTGMGVLEGEAMGAAIGSGLEMGLAGAGVEIIANEAGKKVPNPPTYCKDDCGLATP